MESQPRSTGHAYFGATGPNLATRPPVSTGPLALRPRLTAGVPLSKSEARAPQHRSACTRRRCTDTENMVRGRPGPIVRGCLVPAHREQPQPAASGLSGSLPRRSLSERWTRSGTSAPDPGASCVDQHSPVGADACLSRVCATLGGATRIRSGEGSTPSRDRASVRSSCRRHRRFRTLGQGPAPAAVSTRSQTAVTLPQG